jgi:hypothetical protein
MSPFWFQTTTSRSHQRYLMLNLWSLWSSSVEPKVSEPIADSGLLCWHYMFLESMVGLLVFYHRSWDGSMVGKPGHQSPPTSWSQSPANAARKLASIYEFFCVGAGIASVDLKMTSCQHPVSSCDRICTGWVSPAPYQEWSEESL